MRFLAIQPKNVLSFGPNSSELALGPLNVLIGPNGSGKSNLIHVFSLLRAAATDLSNALEDNGDTSDWIWEHNDADAMVAATFAADGEDARFKYELVFGEQAKATAVQRERLAVDGKAVLDRDTELGVMQLCGVDGNSHQERCPVGQTALAAADDGFWFPDVHRTRQWFADLSIYRDWAIGRLAPARRAQKPSSGSAVLNDDAGNLGLVLNRLAQNHDEKARLLDALREVYDDISDFRVVIEHDFVKIMLREGGVEIPAARLSDGTLRYLCLLAILCHPRPPAVVCLEEPELGLHPDILPGLADLLKDASNRCQLIVTTHSDALVDKLSDVPESVVICEKHDGQTRMNRVDGEQLKEWLKEYTLGDLWMRGDIGGTRW